ncbi:SDR family oxidoreductase [Pengzhenrongella phosphoraccumulans]|uniref:SDR family oxidoreductase n=1 Tax=Pengzhenrongella phosphoraccumulans TaxID=3114394 RepID=UPI00388F1473
MSTPSGSTPAAAARTVLITGTSTGIGLATAIACARAGWTTIATMRNLERADLLRHAAAEAGVEITIDQLDVTSDASALAAVAAVVERFGHLDAVVNNAGAAQLGTAELMGLDEFRAAMEVNFFGVVRLTQAALPHLRASGGRVLTISSVGGVVGQPFNEAYCAAKFAVEGFMESLQPVARTVGVDVCLVEPGAVASEFVANAGIDPEQALAAAGPYAPALSAYLQRTRAQFGTAAQSAEEVGRQVAELLGAAHPPFRSQTSPGATQFVSSKLADLDGSAVTGMTLPWVTG